MSILDQLRAEYEAQAQAQAQQSRNPNQREATTTIGGDTITIDDSETVQSLSNSYLTSGANLNGVPRGREAFEAREIARTQPMQVILNAIVDQLTGGALAYPSDDEDTDQAEADLQALVDDILRGPHLDGADFDDLVAAAVADMVGPGNAYYSTTHHSRFYRDNELPPGLLSVREATQNDVDDLRDELEAAKGDPRAAPVVGTDARWVEVGGSAVDLNVIEEQKWFMRLCAAAFGIPQTELGMVEDVNRAEGDNQLTLVHKRVTKPLAETIGQAFTRQLLSQFELYQQLDGPFAVRLQFSDPRQERAHEEFVRGRWDSGLATYQEVRNEIGEGDPDDETTVTINGQTIDYGEHPRHVVEALLVDARNDDPPGTEQPGAE